jgi:hypothetical protein
MWRDKMALLELIEDTDESLEEEEDEWTEPACVEDGRGTG